MDKTVSLWYLVPAVFKWSMFRLHFVDKKWDTCSYSVQVQYVGRVWSPTYWLRALIVYLMLWGNWSLTKRWLINETNLTCAPSKSLYGHIKHTIPKPIRYLYFFTILYTA